MKMKKRHWKLYREEFDRLQSRCNELENEQKNIYAMRAEATRKYQEASALVKEAQDDVDKTKAELDSYKEAVNSATEIMDVARSRVNDLRERNKRQENMIATLQKEISRLRTLATNQSESLAQQELTLQRTVLANRNLREQIYRAGMDR